MGILDRPWDYYLGPHLSQAIRNIPEAAKGIMGLIGPQADVAGMYEDANEAGKALREGNYGQAAVSTALAGAAIPMMFLPGSVKGVKEGIRAYHGSPHDFDKFDMSKIGTGEGAQSYGHGLYFAENEGVARSYRDALSRGVDYKGAGLNIPEGPQGSAVIAISNKIVGGMDPASAHAATLAEYAKAAESARKAASVQSGDVKFANLDRAKAYNDILVAAKGISPEDFSVSPGRMYEVNINAAPEQFLDWDKPLAQQALKSESIDRVLLRAPSPPPGRGESFGPYTLKELSEYGATGRDLYDRLSWATGKPGAFPEINVSTPHGASAALRDAGIPGIKYLDQGSRGAGEGTRNYVVFDPELIEIIRKYGLAAVLGGSALAGAYGGDANASPILDGP